MSVTYSVTRNILENVSFAVSHAGYSPSFKRPAEILRMRRKRARSEARVRVPLYPLFGQGCSGGGVKRRNPFASIENTFSSPAKKKVFIYTDDDSSDSVKADGSAGVEGEKSTTRTLPFSERLLQAEVLNEDFQHFILCVSESPGWCSSLHSAPCVCGVPCRLVLFTSLLPFSRAVQPRATEEAQGLTQHCIQVLLYMLHTQTHQWKPQGKGVLVPEELY
uniref:Uncharacterized protein n=1 Tax=Salmo trutta TaxID=8032 RepID=A0A674BB61_SALTR